MLRPLNTNVILKKEKEEKTTASGIVLVAPEKKASNQARVIGVGSKCDVELKVSDLVIFKEYSGTHFQDGDDEYLIVDEKDILAIVE